MVSGLICGIGSLPRDEDEFERQTRSADSSPRKCRSSKASKNPYSNRGLDKFSALLAEIDEKRQQIYSQVNPNEISLVRFVYSGDHDIKPIVVKTKTKTKTEPEKPGSSELSKPKINDTKLDKLPSSLAVVKDENNDDESVCEKKKLGFYTKLRSFQWNDPRFYLPIIVIFILGILVLFGRSFAIMCTSIGWYAIPTITNNNNSLNKRVSFKKKDYASNPRLSDKKLMTSEGTTSFKSSHDQNGHRKTI